MTAVYLSGPTYARLRDRSLTGAEDWGRWVKPSGDGGVFVDLPDVLAVALERFRLAHGLLSADAALAAMLDRDGGGGS